MANYQRASIALFLFMGLNSVSGQEAERGTIVTLTERGEHISGQRVGIWEYYDHPSRLALKVDYENRKLLFISPDTSQFFVREGSRWVKRRLRLPCRFAGSVTSLIDHYDQFRIPTGLIEKSKFFSAWLTFEIGPDGNAVNPEVHNDPGSGVKEQILKLFDSAPNFWIAGSDETGPQTCRKAIRFDFCIICEQSLNFPAKVLFTGINPIRGGPLSGSAPLFAFSPDDKKLMIMPSMVGLNTSKQSALIIDVTTKESRQLKYEHADGLWWTDTDKILFMPKYYSRTPVVFAELELTKNKMTFVSDSTTLGHVVSANGKKLAFMNARQSLYKLYYADLNTENCKEVIVSKTPLSPVMWSPDGSSLLVHENQHGFQKYSVINVESGKSVQLPVMNAPVCGWSMDGTIIYQVKSTRNEYTNYREKESPTAFSGIVSVQTIRSTRYEPKSELIETSLLSGSVNTIFKKNRDFQVRYSSTKQMFILMIDDDVYLLGVNSDEKPTKIIEKSLWAEWSNRGEYIAYVSSRDKRLNLYRVETRQSEYFPIKN